MDTLSLEGTLVVLFKVGKIFAPSRPYFKMDLSSREADRM